ncbi:MAG: LamG-like jellyroll fold domain-containing protein, partial [Spirochaetota bacterium]
MDALRSFPVIILSMVIAGTSVFPQAKPAVEFLFDGSLKNTGALGGEASFDNPFPDEGAKLAGTAGAGMLDMNATVGGMPEKDEKHGGAVVFSKPQLSGSVFTLQVTFTPSAVDDLPRTILELSKFARLYTERGLLMVAVTGKKVTKYLSVPLHVVSGTGISLVIVIDIAADVYIVYEYSAGAVLQKVRSNGMPPDADFDGGMVIGNTGGKRPFKGSIDTVRIWNSALSKDDIAKVFEGKLGSGTIELRNVSARPRDDKPALTADLTLVPSVPAGVAFRGEQTSVTANISNRLPAERSFILSVDITNDAGTASSVTHTISAGGGQAVTLSIPVPMDDIGYAVVSAVLKENGVPLSSKETAIALVHKPRIPGAFTNSFFGVMSANLQSEGASRIGSRNQRQFLWMSSYKPGMRDDAWWKRRDNEIESVRAQGMDVMLTLHFEDNSLPSYTGWKSVEDAVTPEGLKLWREFVREATMRYKDKVIGIELINEPDLCFWHLPKYSLEKASSIYAALLKAGAEEIRAIAPGMPVLGLDVSGRDYNAREDAPGGFVFTKAVLGKAADAIDVFTGHPYLYNRVFRGGVMAQIPDEMNFRGLHLEVSDILKKTGRPIRQWSSEIGWGVVRGQSALSESSVRLAAVTAQALTIMKSVPGFEKVFWFICHDHYETVQSFVNYGLFWCDENFQTPPGPLCTRAMYPSATAAAFATAAFYLEGAQFIREIKIDGVSAWRFDRSADKESTVVLWTPKHAEVTLTANAPKSAAAFSMFGRRVSQGA